MGAASSEAAGVESPTEVQRLLAEFAELNRRRLFGSPALEIEEVEAWTALRVRLERHFDAQGSSPWKGIERRQFLRLPTHIRIRFGGDGELRSASVENISQGGLFIATERPLDRGARVLLVLEEEAGGQPVEIRGSVSWSRSKAHGEEPAGMGIAFDDLDREQIALVDRLIERALDRS